MSSRLSCRVVCLAAVALLGVVPPRAQAPDDPPYVRRGHDVDVSHEAYVDRLQRYHAHLRDTLTSEAPALVPRLAPKPSPPVPAGYQILPKLTPGRAGAPAGRPASVVYSWPRTQGIIDNELTKLAGDEGVLDIAGALPLAARQAIYEHLVDNYGWLIKNREIAESHVRHNRFWQQQIAANPERFAQQTVMHDAIVRGDANAVETVRRQTAPAPPAFLRKVERAPNDRVLHVPIYTDITDTEFLARAERVIEDVWTVVEDGVRYSVDVELRRVAMDGPRPGAPLDVAAHAARFPADGAVLTTGADRTYGIVGRLIALGPGDISGNVLAHEFGHILGFPDRYVRGSRDLGDAGLEILEIVPDFNDIMAAPGTGQVMPVHVRQLLDALP